MIKVGACGDQRSRSQYELRYHITAAGRALAAMATSATAGS
jgi:hypothetical protein